jgi:hypothetical protein
MLRSQYLSGRVVSTMTKPAWAGFGLGNALCGLCLPMARVSSTTFEAPGKSKVGFIRRPNRRVQVTLRRYSVKPTFLRTAVNRGSLRIRSSSGKLRILPTLTGPNTVMRSSAWSVRSLSPRPAKIRA